MPYKKYDLPKYPLEKDMWDMIAEDKRPIVVYGMGNGADKLFERLEGYKVRVSDVFASDGFVRGHSFRGFKVISFSDVKAKYDDFLILLSFASNRSEVIDMIKKMDETHDLYIPDMPVAGEDYFDKRFYNDNYESIIKAYDALCDEDSKALFAAMINYKLFGRLEYLMSSYSTSEEIYELLPKSIERAVDAGAYNGDTVRELISYRPDVKMIYAIEPDKRNFKKLSKYVFDNSLMQMVEPVNAAVWDSDTDGSFRGSGNRNSSVNSTVSYENKKEEVALSKIDSIVNGRIDYIKYDVEGVEYEALRGSDLSISSYHPALLVSAYHRSRDIFYLINYLADNYTFYRIYLRRTLCFPAWEIGIIALA